MRRIRRITPVGECLETRTMLDAATVLADRAALADLLGGSGFNRVQTASSVDGGATNTETYTPNGDGPFTYHRVESWSHGATVPTSGDPGGTPGGNYTLDVTITAGTDSTTITTDMTRADNGTYSGTIGDGTWTANMMEWVHFHDTLTVFTSGEVTESYSFDGTMSANYSMNFSVDGFSVTITGNDSVSIHYSGGTGIVQSSQKDTSQSLQVQVSGTDVNNGQIDVTAQETIGYHESTGPDPNNPGGSTTSASWTDQGSESYSYSGSGSFGGASYTVSNLEGYTFDNSGTATRNASGLTRDTTGSWTNQNDYHLTLGGIDDASGGAGSDSLQEDNSLIVSGTASEHQNPGGTTTHRSSRADFSNSVTGNVSSQPFSITESGWNSLVDGGYSSSLSNFTQTGSPPTVYLAGARIGVSDMAYMTPHYAFGAATGVAGTGPLTLSSPWGPGSGPQGAIQAANTTGQNSPSDATNTLTAAAFAAQPDEDDEEPMTPSERAGYAIFGALGGGVGIGAGVLVGGIPFIGPFAGVVVGVAGVGIGMRVGGAIGQSIGGYFN